MIQAGSSAMAQSAMESQDCKMITMSNDNDKWLDSSAMKFQDREMMTMASDGYIKRERVGWG